MTRFLTALAINIVLAFTGIAFAYGVERALYAASGNVWQLQVTFVGLFWFLVMACGLGVLTIFNGVDLSGGVATGETRNPGSADAFLKLPQKIVPFLQHERMALVRALLTTKVFWRRSITFTITLATLILGIRGIGLEGMVAPKPNEIVFLKQDPAPPVSAAVQASLTIFFENGDARLSPSNAVLVTRFAEMALACEIDAIDVSGTASAAQFRERHDIRNPELANMRVQAVQDAIHQIAKNKVQTHFKKWDSEVVMGNSRWLLDVDSSGKHILAAEPFNRRVDLLIKTKGKCQYSPRK